MRARGARADLEQAAGVDVRDGPAARADGVDVEHRRLQRVAVDVHLAGELGLALLDQRDVGRRAAHVEGDEVRVAREDAGPEAAHDPGRGAGEHGAHGLRARHLEGHHAAVGGGDVAWRVDAGLVEARAEMADVAVHHRAQVGVDHGRRQALELAELRRHLARAGDEGLRVLLRGDRADHRLVARVDVAVEEADRDRARAGLLQPADGGAHLGLVEGALDAAVVAQALADLDAHVAGDEQLRLVALQVVEMRPALAADLEQVAEAVGRDEARPDAAMLDQRVGRHGRAMAEIADVAAGRAGCLVEPLDDAAGDRARRIVWRARDLPDPDLARLLVHQADVRERTARIDSNPPHAQDPPVVDCATQCADRPRSSARDQPARDGSRAGDA